MAEKKTIKKTAVKEAAKTTEKKPAKTTVKKAVKKVIKDEYTELFELNKTDILLDIGCGTGEFLAGAAKSIESAVGLDCSAEQLTQANETLKKTKNITLLEGWVQDAHFEQGSFTKVSIKDTIRNLNNHEKGVLLHKVSHWIRPGGIIVVRDMITSFGLHRKDERHELIEAECAAYYGDKWLGMRDSFYEELYHGHPSDLSLMMHHFLFTGFNVQKIIKHTSCLCTIVAQK
ncbi:Methyltransferase domain-containing protein [Parelusimicrobium proximum]|uniref:class I SAM-dependent methyltransferase n=1 Tax=Parelusimicrobium proximum TaxID=3228953 RepID=UPI003D17CD9F